MQKTKFASIELNAQVVKIAKVTMKCSLCNIMTTNSLYCFRHEKQQVDLVRKLVEQVKRDNQLSQVRVNVYAYHELVDARDRKKIINE